MGRDSEIKETIRRIAGVNSQHFFHAEVESLSDETCTVSRNGYSFSDVRFCAVEDGNANNLLIKPKPGSPVLVADLSDGNRRELVIIQWSEVDSIIINGGNLGGLVKIAKLLSWMQNVKTDLTQIASALNGLGAPVTITASTPTRADYEDTKIKH
jgi:hypothetical protein